MERHAIQDPLTESVIGAFYDVYNALGFGFLECHYTKALALELLERGHEVGREVYFPVMYKGHLLGRHRLDMLVDKTLIVEAKATVELAKADTYQVHNYLRATNLRVALLLHFGPEAKVHRFTPRARAPKNHPLIP